MIFVDILEGGCEGVVLCFFNVKSICEGFYGMNDDWCIWVYKNSLSGEFWSDRENKGVYFFCVFNLFNVLCLL